MEFDHELWIPIVLFLVTGAVFVAFYLFRYKTSHDLQTTVRAAIEQGQQLTPEVLERLGRPRPGPHQDLRRGVVLVALGLAVAVLGLALNDDDAIRPMLAIGAFPAIIGVAYLGLWRFAGRS